MNENVIIQNIIDKYFQNNPDTFVKHHLDSYNNFFDNDIKRIFKENNPIQIMKQKNSNTNDFDFKCKLFSYFQLLKLKNIFLIGSESGSLETELVVLSL